MSADLHQRFVEGNNEGRITAEAAVLSAFLVSHGILRYGTITGEMRRRAADALETVGAAHLASRTLDRMSSGEARRILLARALVLAPRVLVLDEPPPASTWSRVTASWTACGVLSAAARRSCS